MENVPWRPPGSVFGDGFAGWPPGRSGIVRIMVRENPSCTRIAEAGEQKIHQLEEAIAGRRCRKQTGFDTFRVQAASLLPVMQVRAHQARQPRAEWRTEIESASAAGASTARLQGPSSSMPAASWRAGCRP